MAADENLHRIDLNLLVVLRTLLETRSVTKTAQQTGMSQPAVSRALAKLREVFGDALLVKAGTVMRPTVRGSQLLEPVQKALAGIADVLAERPAFDPLRSERVFRIATTDYGATVILPRLAGLLGVEAPRASVEIVPVDGQTFKTLGETDVDLALYSDNPVPPHLHARDLFRETFACLLRAGHPAIADAEQGRISLDDYVAASHILVSIVGGGPGTVDNALAVLGRSRHVAMRIPYFATAALLAASSDLVLTIPRRAAENFSDDSRLCVVEPPLQLPNFGYRMVWHERVHAEPDHAWLRRLVLRAVRLEEAPA
ncbi:LysR family transcriptional regulator [Rhodopseudomonas palustris]|uniref:LysR family transcriptional regulator n=1 Tax=Rhodopseudomonas palustris TaxID=1076 RepID=A0A418VQL5_RHOPL|nr:LysR family transcriptional regulator [Rhodopseudomonas palustris]RJF78619.1 LysR family transcriptional regulator [Rhodopseudomonas palustris]